MLSRGSDRNGYRYDQILNSLSADRPVDRGRNRSETFAEFARAEGFSLSTFYKLKKLGLGPDVLHVPGTARA
jgi:hypothetical protein